MIRNAFSIVLIILALCSIYFGAYLPLRKAQLYISALNEVRNVRTMEGFREMFLKAFAFYSPIGDEEMAKFFGNDTINIVLQQKQNEAVAREFVAFTKPFLMKNNVRHLIILSNLHSILWKEYGRKADFVQAENYLRTALVFGPKLPPVLYGLLDLYQYRGDREKIREIATTILTYWPSDTDVQTILADNS